MARKETTITRLLNPKIRNQVKSLLQKTGSLLTPSLLVNPSISAKYFANSPSSNEYYVTRPAESNQNLAVPNKSLRIGENSAEEFVSSGKIDFDNMVNSLKDDGYDPLKRNAILEFGCSSGRMIRNLHETAATSEVWGVDLASEHIYWCQNNLTPINFATVTTLPHLPFEDSYFDFIYAGSVFTHIDDLAFTWFLELRRVLKKGGILFVTLHDESTIKYFENNSSQNPFQKMILETKACNEYRNDKNVIKFTVGRSLMSHVFYRAETIQKDLSKFFKIVSYKPNLYQKYQSAITLVKK